MKSEVNIKTSRINRKADNIKTEATEDLEKITTYHSQGNSFLMEYNNQVLKGSNHENNTCRFTVNSPISGFSAILTAGQLSMFPTAGSFPTPTVANVSSSSGVARFGKSAPSSIGLALGIPTIACFKTIASMVDAIGSIHCIPPLLSPTINAMSRKITSKVVFG
jgi:hypothetical protein